MYKLEEGNRLANGDWSVDLMISTSSAGKDDDLVHFESLSLYVRRKERR